MLRHWHGNQASSERPGAAAPPCGLAGCCHHSCSHVCLAQEMFAGALGFYPSRCASRPSLPSLRHLSGSHSLTRTYHHSPLKKGLLMPSRQLKTFLLCLGYYLRQALFLNQTLVLQTLLVTVQAISVLRGLLFLQALGPFQQEQLHEFCCFLTF